MTAEDEWELPPMGIANTEEIEEIEPETDWLENARLIPADFDCPVRIPSLRGRAPVPLNLTFPKLALYHAMIEFTGDDDDDKPSGMQDSAALLFLAAHEPRTWNTLLSSGHPLRQHTASMWAAVDQWAAQAFEPEDRKLAKLIAVRLWTYHAGERPLAEKKTTSQTISNQSGPHWKINTHGSSPEAISPEGLPSMPCPSGTFTLHFTAIGASTESPSPHGE